MIQLEVDEVDGSMLNYFLQPNSLPDDHEPKNIQENGLVVVNIGPGEVLKLPADWMIHMSFSFNIQLDTAGIEWPTSGKIRMRVTLQDLTKPDVEVLQ